MVVGNESADLDSLTSSLLYSYLRSLAPPSGAFTPLYIPLLNISAADIRLRPEFEAVFHHANIDASHLVTLDDLPKANGRSLDPEDIKFVLVDHNNLQGELGKKYAARVQGVIDHHEDEGTVCSDTSPEPRLVEKCGSCTSLVVRTFKSSWESSTGGFSALASGAAHAQGDSFENDASVTRIWDAQTAKMALASILVDTANLTAEGKVEEADVEAVKYLESKIKLSSQDAAQWDRAKFYESIDSAKRDIDAMNFEDILRKDYKQWTENGLNLGVASVVKPLKFLIGKVGGDRSEDQHLFVTFISDFMAARSLTIFAIMTTFILSSGKFQRELYVQALPSGRAAAQRFAQQAKEELRLEDHEIALLYEKHDSMESSHEGLWYAPFPLLWMFLTSDIFQFHIDHVNRRKVWLQRDVSKSRKQVAPLLRNAMKEAA